VHGSHVSPTSGSCATGAETHTWQVRSQIRCIWILRDEAQPAKAARGQALSPCGSLTKGARIARKLRF
jgi:hypothetical protein